MSSSPLRIIRKLVPVREDEGLGFPFRQVAYEAVQIVGSNVKHNAFDGEGWNSPPGWVVPFGGVESHPTPPPDPKGKALNLEGAIGYLNLTNSPTDRIMSAAYPGEISTKDRNLYRASGALHKFAVARPSPFTNGYTGGARPTDGSSAVVSPAASVEAQQQREQDPHRLKISQVEAGQGADAGAAAAAGTAAAAAASSYATHFFQTLGFPI